MGSKEKFTNKVADYVKYRPSYPQELLNYLVNEVGMSPESVAADIGAGTGILTKLLAGIVGKIYAVEPNLNMREACILSCNEFDNFTAVDGSAENTTLEDQSVDFITVAQAFHWFDRPKTKLEFQRIIKQQGKVILIWNSRVPDNEMIKEHEDLCRAFCPEFGGLSGGIDTRPEAFDDFFKDGYCEHKVFDNDMALNLESYIGGTLSASYAPSEKDENYKPFIDALIRLFKKYSYSGRLLMPNVTRSYTGSV